MHTFKNFSRIRNAAETATKLLAHAKAHGITALEVEALSCNPEVWAPEACRALGLRGRSRDLLSSVRGEAFAQLCELASALVAVLISRCPGVDWYAIQERVNLRVLELSS
jgi:hypothetical protein